MQNEPSAHTFTPQHVEPSAQVPQEQEPQSPGQLPQFSPGPQKPSPHTCGQSAGQLAAVSSVLQVPSPQRWQSKSAPDGAGQFALQVK